MIYQFKKGSVFPGKPDAQSVGEALVALCQNGPIEKGAIIEAGRDSNSPLHGCFTWDVTAAVDKCHKYEEHYLKLNIVQVKTFADEGFSRITPVIVSVRTTTADQNTERMIVTLEQAMEDGDYRAQLLERARREWLGYESKFKDLQELAALFEIGKQVFAQAT